MKFIVFCRIWKNHIAKCNSRKNKYSVRGNNSEWNEIQQTAKTSYGIRPPRRCFNDEINSLRNIVCKWVGDCCLTPSANILSYVMARTNHTLMRWWWYQLFLTNMLSCIFYSANPMKQQSGGRHVIPFGRIILISIQPVIAIALWCCMLRGETVCTNYIVLVWTDWGSQPTICHTQGEHRKKPFGSWT